MTETQAIRRRLEAIVEQALEMLDTLDGDPDAEPYLAWTGNGPSALDCPGDDREDDGDLDEPTLGWTLGGRHGAALLAEHDEAELEDEHGADEDDGTYLHSGYQPNIVRARRINRPALHLVKG